VANSSRSLASSEDFNSSPLKIMTEKSSSEVINILQGKKEGSLEALATAY
jgi:predicted CopG family antitoxin